MRVAPIVLSLLLALGLTGCIEGIEKTDEVVEAENKVTEQEVEPVRLIKDDRARADPVGSPVWEVGTAFGQHFYFGPDDKNGTHITSVVVEETGDAYVMAATDPRSARQEAYWDLPMVGTFDKETLATTGFGMEWDWWFAFPLTDGKTWSRHLPLPDRDGTTTERNITFTAHYTPTVKTNGITLPGYHIVGASTSGVPVFEYHYLPDIGWYDHFYWYDAFGPDPDAWLFHGMSMGVETGWTGDYYIDTITQVLDYESTFYPDPIDPRVSPDPLVSFDVSSDATYLMGAVFSFAYLGANSVVLVTPESEVRHYDAVHSEFDPQLSEWPDGESYWIDETAQGGTWHIAHLGASVSQIARAELFAITERSYRLEGTE